MNTQINNQSNVMPLMMAFTKPTPITEETPNDQLIYDEDKQIVYSTMGILGSLFSDKVGTRSLRSEGILGITAGKSTPDKKKNEIDDQKEKK